MEPRIRRAPLLRDLHATEAIEFDHFSPLYSTSTGRRGGGGWGGGGKNLFAMGGTEDYHAGVQPARFCGAFESPFSGNYWMDAARIIERDGSSKNPRDWDA